MLFCVYYKYILWFIEYRTNYRIYHFYEMKKNEIDPKSTQRLKQINNIYIARKRRIRHKKKSLFTRDD